MQRVSWGGKVPSMVCMWSEDFGTLDQWFEIPSGWSRI